MLTDLYTPGWLAFVNGKETPVQRINGVFKGICLNNAGDNIVEFRYSYPNLGVFKLVAFLAFSIFMAILFYLRRLKVEQSHN